MQLIIQNNSFTQTTARTRLNSSDLTRANQKLELLQEIKTELT